MADHLSKIAHKVAPVPGTQVAHEQRYEDAMKAYHAKKDCDREARKQQLAFKMEVKQRSAALNTSVHFDTVFGQSIGQIEALLEENEVLLNKDEVDVRDDQAAILKFKSNVEKGNHYYVGFAISKGFKSINYQDPDSGNSFLHIAARRGHVQMVEELLKYNANPDVKNRLGNYPMHEAWLFWNTNALRKKEERLAQESKTCAILLRFYSYGAYVDACDLMNQTTLHVACRLGPVQAVKILLTFQCNPDLLTKDQRSAVDIAREFHHDESLKLLQAWHGIRRYLVQADFHTVWHKFLVDYESSMQASKPASQLLSELELTQNAQHMARVGREQDVFVDDPFLLQALRASRELDSSGKVPRPWEKNWKRYVKLSKAAGLIDLKTKLESLQGRVRGSRKAIQQRIGNNEADKRRSLLPDRPTPLTWSQQQLLATTDENVGQGDGYGEYSPAGVQAMGRNLSTSLSRSASTHKSAFSDLQAASQDDDCSISSAGTSASPGSLPASLFSASHVHARIPSTSLLHQRRQNFAHQVALDAKFAPFTKRFAHASVLSLPLRTPQAPLEGTEEASSVLRHVLSQGVDFDRLAKYKQQDRFAEMLGMERSPVKDKLGAYSEPVQFSKLNPRDVLYDSLFLSIQAAAKEMEKEEGDEGEEGAEKGLVGLMTASTIADTKKGGGGKAGAVKVEVEKRKKIDLVHDRRPRYVERSLLPVKEEATVVEKMIRAQQEKELALRLKKQGLATESGKELARLEMEKNIANAQANIDTVVAAEDGPTAIALMASENERLRTASRQRKRMETEKTQVVSKLFLYKEQVKYGQGRLTSSHNLKGKIEEPWETVGGRYVTRAGDRTA